MFRAPNLVKRWHSGEATEAESRGTEAIIEGWRVRLHHVSWFMQCLNEHLAGLANAEDRCSGGFVARLNVYGRENGDAYEWDERRGVNIIEGLDEPLPTIGNQVRILLDARRMSRSLRLPIEIAHHRR